MIVSDQERGTLLVAVEYFLGLAEIMPARWIRPGVVTDCIDLADKLVPKTRDEKAQHSRKRARIRHQASEEVGTEGPGAKGGRVMTKKRRVEICDWLCEECCRGTRLQWVDVEKVRHWVCIDCIHAREDAEKDGMIESAKREAGEFLRAGGMMS